MSVPTPVTPSRSQSPSCRVPSAVTAGVTVAVTSAPPRSTVTDMVSPAASMAARKSAEDAMSRPSMRQITSPGSSPASLAGVALPPGVSTSARSATSTPAVVI